MQAYVAVVTGSAWLWYGTTLWFVADHVVVANIDTIALTDVDQKFD